MKIQRAVFSGGQVKDPQNRSIRKTMAIFALTSAVILGDPAFASATYEGQPQPVDAQSVSWDHGIALMQSKQAHSQLGVKFLQYDNSKLFFLILLKNASDSAVDFGLNQVSAHDALGANIKVYSKDELIRAIKQKRDAKKFFAILGATAGVLASVAASQQTRSGTAYDSNGRSYSYMERYTDNGILTAGTAVSVGAGALVLVGANKNANAKIKYLNENYLTRQTIPGGSEIVGIIETDLPNVKSGKSSVELTVNVSGDVHDMKFDILKQ